MSTTSSRIISIYKSRNVLLEQLAAKGYLVDDYLRFSINEVDAMLANSQLDMLISHPNNTKVYIKYYFTYFLFIVLMYVFTLFAYYFLQDSYPAKFCDSTWICLISAIDKSFKVDGGLGGFMSIPEDK